MAKKPSNKTIDFEAVNRAVLSRLESFLEQWLPSGRYEGKEYVALNPLRADRNLGSFRIHRRSCKWSDFATRDGGRDAISLYAYLFGLERLDAARELGITVGVLQPEPNESLPSRAVLPPDSKPSKKKRSSDDEHDWKPVIPAPMPAPAAALRHFHYGDPVATWTYLTPQGELIGYVRRFTKSNGDKETIPKTFCIDEHGIGMWREKSFPDPRPLYGLTRLYDVSSLSAVLVVEGEKCADAGHRAQTRFPVLTWPGGSNAVQKADWTPLTGRKVNLWPDCDAQHEKLTKAEKEAGIDPLSKPLLTESEQPGIVAMEKVAKILTNLGCEVQIIKIPAPGEKPNGWDIADAIDEGWSESALLDFIENNLRPPACVASAAVVEAKPAKKKKNNHQQIDLDKLANRDWEIQLSKNPETGKILPTLGNVVRILTCAKEWKGLIAYDEFSGRTVKQRPPPFDYGQAGEWTDTDDILTMLWLERCYGLVIKKPLVIDGVIAASEANKIYPLKDYLFSLKWDNKPRLNSWLVEYLGARIEPGREKYLELAGTKWLVGAIARILEPGCKMDNVLILDGPQGLKKSTTFEVLAGEEYFTDAPFKIGDKEGYDIMRGKWIVELSELDSFYRAEDTSAKRFFSQKMDRYRMWYGKRSQDIKRRCVFGGTVNASNYLKDPSGNRRYWPVSCRKIDLQALQKDRDQLWAEALKLYQDGVIWHVTDEEKPLFEVEQDDRYEGDALEDDIAKYINVRNSTSVNEVLSDCLKLDKSKWTRSEQKRIASILQRLGYERYRLPEDSSGYRPWGYRKIKEHDILKGEVMKKDEVVHDESF